MANVDIETGTFTIEQSAKRLGIGRDLAYRMAKAGTLPGIARLNGKYIVRKVVLEEFLMGQSPKEEPVAGATGGS
jgi:excisionase family DNA binding protein